MDSLGYFETIDPDECRRLLADAVVGRVAWVSPSRGVQVLPVNYTLVDGRIVFNVAEGSVLSELTQPVDVAFQVDDLDRETATGWAVLVQGRTVPSPQGHGGIQAWAPGRREVPVEVQPTTWSGRSVSSDEG